jgi:methylisocitrate lyase
MTISSCGARLRAALGAEQLPQVSGAICACHAILAEKSGCKAHYLSGAGVATTSVHSGRGHE